MKKSILSTLLLSVLSGNAYGQNPDPLEGLDKIQEQASKAAACLEKLDQNYLKQQGVKIEAHEREIKNLCESGKRNEAQAKAESHARERMADPEFKKSLECAALLDFGDEGDDEDIHICEDL